MATVLQKYFEKGWLKYGNEQIGETGRMDAAGRFYGDFYKAGISDMRIPDISKPKVDGVSAFDVPDFVLAARARFNKACRALSSDFEDVVMKVVCFDEEISTPDRHTREVKKEYLCRGLDEIYFTYYGKMKPVYAHKIEGMVNVASDEDFNKWFEKIKMLKTQKIVLDK